MSPLQQYVRPSAPNLRNHRKRSMGSKNSDWSRGCSPRGKGVKHPGFSRILYLKIKYNLSPDERDDGTNGVNPAGSSTLKTQKNGISNIR